MLAAYGRNRLNARRLALLVAVVASLLAVAAIVWARSRATPSSDMSASVVQVLSSAGDEELYARVTGPRELVFPADAGPHPEFRTEWWYYTGNVEDESGRPFGYQLTFFRNAMAPDYDGSADGDGAALSDETTRGDGIAPTSNWRTNQIYLAHFALTDPESDAYHSAERLSRGAAGLAGAQAAPFRVWVEGWGAESSPAGAAAMATSGREARALPAGQAIRLYAADAGVELELQLEPAKPTVLHGDGGFSPKGPEPGNASYYYSDPRLATRGAIITPRGVYEVTGESWMDHEWSTSALDAESQTGWDWFSLQLDDGRELMVFQIRERDGGIAAVSSGSLIDVESSVVHLKASHFDIEALDTWRSPRTGATYPSRWSMRVPEHGIDLEVVPLLNDQELQTFIRYWEGAVTATGTIAGKRVGGRGYVELTGYADGQAPPGTGW